jgi:hypothetical protein
VAPSNNGMHPTAIQRGCGSHAALTPLMTFARSRLLARAAFARTSRMFANGCAAC